jgi:hypothetical protein
MQGNHIIKKNINSIKYSVIIPDKIFPFIIPILKRAVIFF